MYDNIDKEASTEGRTQMTLWKGSSPRRSHVRMTRNNAVTQVRDNRGAMPHVRNTRPRPDRKGGLERAVLLPKLILLKPGYISATPTVLAAAQYMRSVRVRSCHRGCAKTGR